jgi:glycosyltransferase involved in cell wall biosynthesis
VSSGPEVVLLWLEPAGIGAAARTHLDGTRARLKRQNANVVAEFYSEGESGGAVSKLRRIWRLITSARSASRPGRVLVARWHPFLGLVLRSWKRRGGTVVLLVQGNDQPVYEVYPWFRKMPFARALMRESLVQADRVLTLNEGVQSWCEQQFAEAGRSAPISILPTGVSDVFLSHPTPAVDNAPYAAFVGSLATWQGIELLLEAATDAAWPDHLKLVVVGSGAQEALVRDAVGERVVWLGRKKPAEVAAILAGARLTICSKLPTPSMAETTTPFKILESVAVGVPVVASDIPAQRRMLEADPYGVLYPADDVKALASAVARLATDEKLHAAATEVALRVSPTLAWEYHADILTDAIASAAGDR